jgi:ribosomal protein L19E
LGAAAAGSLRRARHGKRGKHDERGSSEQRGARNASTICGDQWIEKTRALSPAIPLKATICAHNVALPVFENLFFNCKFA